MTYSPKLKHRVSYTISEEDMWIIVILIIILGILAVFGIVHLKELSIGKCLLLGGYHVKLTSDHQRPRVRFPDHPDLRGEGTKE